MPIYEYHCGKCGHVFEVMGSLSEKAAEKSCPKCESAAQKIISVSAFHLKGSGWYSSDYKKKSGGGDTPPCAAKSDSPTCASCAHAQAEKQ